MYTPYKSKKKDESVIMAKRACKRGRTKAGTCRKRRR